MRKAVIIVAGGVGSRAGGSKPKQFVSLLGKPMIFYTLDAFHAYDPEMDIIVVMHPRYIQKFGWDCEKHARYRLFITPGGETRFESVMNGLTALAATLHGSESKECVVAVHDAARPLVDRMLLTRGFKTCGPGIGAVPVTDCVNSLRKITDWGIGSLEDAVSESVVRKDYVEVQTPQIFRFTDLMGAYYTAEASGDISRFTDDASVAEAAGMQIRMYKGNPENIKVTHPIDFKIATWLLREHKLNK